MTFLKKLILKSIDSAKYSTLVQFENRLTEIDKELSAKSQSIKEKEALIQDKEKTLAELLTKNKDLQSRQETIEKELRQIEDSYNDAKDFGPEIPGAYGLYEPKYNLTNSTLYKDKLNAIRDMQKRMISKREAIKINMEWRVNNSKREGNKLISRSKKLALRAFNGECDAIIASVKYYSKYDARRERILRSYQSINNVIDTLMMSISDAYLGLKYQELDLVFEYERRLLEEKQALAKQREIDRDEQIAKKEYEKEQERLTKEQNHFHNEIDKMKQELLKSSEDEREKYEKKINDLTKKIAALEEQKQTFRRLFENKAGYVYIISNIGAFGSDVFKIGTTRRLDPYERIDELCTASVPFRFNAHALIFSPNCYELERDLHNFFERYRMNKTNRYKEFFKVPVAEIEEYVTSKDPTVKFISSPEAIDYSLSK